MKIKIISWIMLLFFMLACGMIGAPTQTATTEVIETQISHPSFTPTPTFTSIPQTEISAQTIEVQISKLNEANNEPAYTIKAQVPSLHGSDNPHVSDFNSILNGAVTHTVNQFKNDVLAIPSDLPVSGGSFLDSQFSVIGQQGDFWSVKFDITTYYAGAAHPGHYSITLNYDLGSGREITLADLFIPGSNYLQTLSDISKTQLATRDISFDSFSSGVDPLPENFNHWNISVDGLVITFDEYQVAPYAAGPQLVVIPFSELQSIENPNGPLALFVH